MRKDHTLNIEAIPNFPAITSSKTSTLQLHHLNFWIIVEWIIVHKRWSDGFEVFMLI